jgi:hypothetical protein
LCLFLWFLVFLLTLVHWSTVLSISNLSPTDGDEEENEDISTERDFSEEDKLLNILQLHIPQSQHPLYPLPEEQSPLLSFDEVASSLTPIVDKVTDHHYGPQYTRYLDRFRNRKTKVKLLEIGLGCKMGYGPGASVQLWLHKDMFIHQNVELYIFELDFECGNEHHTNSGLNYTIIYGDQGSEDDLSSLRHFAPFDIIIDDGGHTMYQQQLSLIHLFPLLRNGGIYILEDYNTSWMDGYNTYQTQYTTLFQTHLWIQKLIRRRTIEELPHLSSIDCGPEMCAFFHI